jgi:hypothetical protein
VSSNPSPTALGHHHDMTQALADRCDLAQRSRYGDMWMSEAVFAHMAFSLEALCRMPNTIEKRSI